MQREEENSLHKSPRRPEALQIKEQESAFLSEQRTILHVLYFLALFKAG